MITMEIAVTRVSSKGQVVIPVEIKKATGIKEKEKLLVIALGDTIILKKISGKTFEQTVRPIWEKARQLGFAEEEIGALIQEAKASGSSR